MNRYFRQEHASFFVRHCPDSDTDSKAGRSSPPQHPSITTPICIKLIWLKRPTCQGPRIDPPRQILIEFETKCADCIPSSSINIQLAFQFCKILMEKINRVSKFIRSCGNLAPSNAVALVRGCRSFYLLGGEFCIVVSGPIPQIGDRST